MEKWSNRSPTLRIILAKRDQVGTVLWSLWSHVCVAVDPPSPRDPPTPTLPTLIPDPPHTDLKHVDTSWHVITWWGGALGLYADEAYLFISQRFLAQVRWLPLENSKWITGLKKLRPHAPEATKWNEHTSDFILVQNPLNKKIFSRVGSKIQIRSRNFKPTNATQNLVGGSDLKLNLQLVDVYCSQKSQTMPNHTKHWHPLQIPQGCKTEKNIFNWEITEKVPASMHLRKAAGNLPEAVGQPHSSVDCCFKCFCFLLKLWYLIVRNLWRTVRPILLHPQLYVPEPLIMLVTARQLNLQVPFSISSFGNDKHNDTAIVPDTLPKHQTKKGMH